MTDTKIAVITGASRGLGRSMALHLAAQGVDIVGTFRSNKEEAANLAQEIENQGRRTAMLQLDVGESDLFSDFASDLSSVLQSEFGQDHFDFLVNNAGIGIYASATDTTEEQFDELMQVQLKGPFFLTQKLLPLMADGGRILNVSSGLARFTIPGYAAYAAAKGGVEVLTRYLAKELGPHGITVNTVAPGVIETDFGGGVVRDNPEMNQQLAATIPLGRVGLPDDVGGAVALLLSEGGNWINGERIEVSGGQNI